MKKKRSKRTKRTTGVGKFCSIIHPISSPTRSHHMPSLMSLNIRCRSTPLDPFFLSALLFPSCLEIFIRFWWLKWDIVFVRVRRGRNVKLWKKRKEKKKKKENFWLCLFRSCVERGNQGFHVSSSPDYMLDRFHVPGLLGENKTYLDDYMAIESINRNIGTFLCTRTTRFQPQIHGQIIP